MRWGFFNNPKKGKRNWQEDYYESYESHSMQEDPYSPSPKAIIYQSELDFISRCILDYPNIETGGELFGFWTQLGTPIVLYAVGPGPNAHHHPTSFVQDSRYVDNVEVDLCNLTGLQHIGQWHSHHQLSLAQPSGGDVASMMRGVGQPGFPRMLLCIGNCTTTTTTINAFNFHENNPRKYKHAAWEIIGIDSPFRATVDSLFNSRLYSPRTQSASYGEMYVMPNKTIQPEKKYQQHWLTKDIENISIMKGFVQSAQSLFPDCEPTTEITDFGEPIISLYSGSYRILFPYGFPDNAPKFVKTNGNLYISDDRITLDPEEIWSRLEQCQYPIDIQFHEWLKSTLTAAIYYQQKANSESNERYMPRETQPASEIVNKPDQEPSQTDRASSNDSYEFTVEPNKHISKDENETSPDVEHEQ